MFAAFTTATIRLLGSIFIWAPPRTRPKIQHLCEDRKIFQPVSRMLILEIHIAFVAVPADVTSHSCHCPPHIFYAPDCFFDIFHMMMTKVWYCHGHDLYQASRDLLRCPAVVKLRTPLMSLTWQRTTVAETCKLKAERINKKLV